MNVIEKNNQIKIEGISDDFEPQHVFDCGQCFRWIRQEDVHIQESFKVEL